MTMRWGRNAAAVLLAAAVAVGASGCGGQAEAEPKSAASAAKEPVSLEKATTAFEAAVTEFDATGGCPSAVGECWDKMTAVMKPARDLRKAMNAHEGTGPEFWSEAYVLIDTMEGGIAIGEDKFSNRPAVLGSAHDLVDWLAAHPVK
ncbi:hypothetical protein ACFWRZ_08820 [Streptomyces rubiginosohelvolus]|uniref:hypothetical protein n=1 Tax=Streptomyces rubiginosohelvolus TaxID=67362 RepID=UPI00366917BC